MTLSRVQIHARMIRALQRRFPRVSGCNCAIKPVHLQGIGLAWQGIDVATGLGVRMIVYKDVLVALNYPYDSSKWETR